MLKKFKLGVIGAGFMSKAIINGVIASKFLNPSEIIVSDVNDDALKTLQNLGVNTCKDNLQILNNSQFTLFAIKPQTFYALENDFSNIENVKIISIMAGVKKDKIKRAIKDSLVCRCMPNTPCSLGYGAVGIDVSDFTCEEDKLFIDGLFSSFSKVVFVNEDKLNTVTAISGSSPAYFYLFAKHLIDFGVQNGLDFNDAKNLVVNTMIGSGMMMKNSDKNIDELINAVCSKGGTTIQAINYFNNSDFENVILNASSACKNRAQEIEEGI